MNGVQRAGRGMTMQNQTLRGTVLLAAVVLCPGPGCSSGGGGGGSGTASRVDYGIDFTESGSFAPLGTGSPTSPPNERFGPEAGYPEPAEIARRDAGESEWGAFLVFRVSEGDLSETTATIVDSSGQVVASPTMDPNSVPVRIGFEIPDHLAVGHYALKLWTPTGIQIAEVKFEIEGPASGEDAEPPVLIGG